MPTRTPYLRFADDLVAAVISGEKTVTARYGFDRGLSPGDSIHLVDESDREFATATIESVEEMTVRQFAEADIEGHRRYSSPQEMVEEMRTYYPNADISPDTTLTVIWFAVIDTEH